MFSGSGFSGDDTRLGESSHNVARVSDAGFLRLYAIRISPSVRLAGPFGFSFHAEWLKTRPGLQVLDDAEIDAQIALRINAIPGRAARLAEVDEEDE